MKKSLKILPGCIGCGLCEALAPQVFKVNNVSKVVDDSDFRAYDQQIEEAAAACPVNVIVYEETEETK